VKPFIFSQEWNTRIARKPETCSIVGLSSSSIDNRLKEGGRWHDPRFPKPIRLGTGQRCAIGWRVDELLAYLEGQRQS
jgi:predicted DNA-binding transcriptional regulator AlpA